METPVRVNYSPFLHLWNECVIIQQLFDMPSVHEIRFLILFNINGIIQYVIFCI